MHIKNTKKKKKKKKKKTVMFTLSDRNSIQLFV